MCAAWKPPSRRTRRRPRLRFVPRDVALEELKATSHLAELLANLDRNPLPHAFSVRTRTSDGAKLDAARAEWSRLPKVDQVSAEFEWAQKISGWTRFAERALAVFALVLAAAVLFIVGHLIRLQVLTMRDEIEVSQLIGATAADVRRPFVYHGFLQGLAAGLAAVGLAALVVTWLNAELRALTSTYAYEFKIVFMDSSCLGPDRAERRRPRNCRGLAVRFAGAEAFFGPDLRNPGGD